MCGITCYNVETIWLNLINPIHHNYLDGKNLFKKPCLLLDIVHDYKVVPQYRKTFGPIKEYLLVIEGSVPSLLSRNNTHPTSLRTVKGLNLLSLINILWVRLIYLYWTNLHVLCFKFCQDPGIIFNYRQRTFKKQTFNILNS